MTDKIEQESLYDGLDAGSTDLLDDPVSDILKVSEGRWEIEECFRIMKTDFEARPVFLALIVYRYLEYTERYEFCWNKRTRFHSDIPKN